MDSSALCKLLLFSPVTAPVEDSEMMAETAVADAVSTTRAVVAILQTEARAVAVVAAVAAALQTTTVIALVVTAT